MHKNNKLRHFIALAILFTLSLAAVAGDDFLLPDQAFQVSAVTRSPESIEVRWKIADGYYLYKNKFSFRSDTPGVELGAPEFSPADVKHDAFFGDVEVYHHQAVVRLPIEHRGDNGTVTIMTRSQGCAEGGICYPPQERPVEVTLPANTTQSKARPSPSQEKPGGLKALTRLGQSLGLQEDRLLTAEEAYRFNAEVADPDHLQLTWQIADGTYLYKDKIRLQLEGAKGVALGPFKLPPAKVKKNALLPDGSLGDIEVYYHGIDLEVPLKRTTLAPAKVRLVAKYQGCADQGVCYPPQTQRVELSLPAGQSAASGVTAPAASPPPVAVTAAPPAATQAGEPASEHDRLSRILLQGNLGVIIAAFFIAGLGLAFTPCVFPMIPILSGIIAGQGAHISPGKGFVLSLVYVLAMAVTYTVAGVLAGLFGENLQVAFQNPWILSIFAAIFVALALSMFGFFELQLPSRLQSRLTELSNRQQGGNLIGVGIMGFLSALIVGPCLAPPLAAALIVIGQTGDAVIGGTALFFLALGMGTPLIIIGTSAGKLLPRAGAWMDTVKAVFGVVMLGVAIYLLERIVPPAVALVLWGVLAIVSAIYMGALRDLPIEATGWARLWKGLGFALLVYGSLMLVGAAADSKDTLQPLRGVSFGGLSTGGENGIPTEPRFKRIKTVADLKRELAAAKAAGKPVLLDFYADWCTYCIQFEKYVFNDPKAAAQMADFVLLQADVTANDADDKALLAYFSIPAPPAIILYGRDGQERRQYRILGYMKAEAFTAHIRQAIAR